MALDVTAQELVVDETTGLQDDDTSASNATITYLLSLDAAGGLSSPQVAFQENFVIASASAGESISTVILTQDSSGTPFSTSVGVNSGIQTVDGDYVWLFKDASNSNVVRGVIGTSDPLVAPLATGPLAYSFALVSTDATHYDLYTVEYVPLLHPVATNPDDQIDLTNKVYASVSATTTVGFNGANAPPGINDFYCLNSPTDASKQVLVTGFLGAANEKPNVSTQGFGVANQSINPTEKLQVDFVTGGTLSGGSASQINYTSHIETITSAGFTINQITPSSPSLRVDLTISTFNVTGNEQGLNFYDGSPTTASPITSIKLTGQSGVAGLITANGTYDVAGNVDVVVSGIGTNAVTITGLDNVTTVDVTASSSFDRLVVTGVDTNEGCDITEFHYSTTTPNAYTEQVGSFINFDDDGPSMANNANAVPTMTNDDTQIPDSDGPTSFASLFTSSFGADGFKDSDNNNIQDADAITYVLGVKNGGSNVASGLTDTLSGDAVVLNKVGNDIVGTVSGTALEVFRVSVSSTGAVTFTQSRSVVHNDPNDSSETGASAAGLSAADLITLTATITDGDGDTASASRDIASAFKFEDDGPSMAGNANAVPTLTTDDTQIPDSDGPTGFASLFTSAFGTDGFKDSDDNNVQDSDAITYVLGVKNGGSNVASGLVDTLSGDAVVLNKVGNDIVGTVTGTALEVFRVSVSSTGAVTLTQSRSVVHNDPNDSSETGASAAGLSAADLITLTATITDGDGDTASASRDIASAFKFEDDGPSMAGNANAVPTMTNDDTQIPDSDGPTSFAGLFTSSFGTDGFKDSDDNNIQDTDAITYVLGVKNGGSNVASGLVDTLTGDAVVLNKVGNDIVGTVTGTALEVFRVSVSSAGAVTFTQSRSVVHNDPNDSSETGASAAGLSAADLITLTATITDGDGDTAPASRDIGSAFKFEDDGPSMAGNANAVPTMTNDDTQIPDSAGPTSFASLFTSSFGQDGFKDSDDNNVQDSDAITYVLGVKNNGSNVASGITDTLTGEAVVLNKVGNDIVGTTTTTALEVFRVSVSSAGAVTFTQSRSVVHNDPNDPVESGTSAAGLSAADLITLTATITDGDGDTASASRDIASAFKFEDDGPTLTAAFDADPVAGGVQTPEQLLNTANATASGTFGYNIGADAHLAAFYTGGGSDFVDASNAAGVQITLTGSVDNAQNPGITQAVATLASESLTSATFNFSFHYDKDPITAGVQDSTAGGTLVFDKVNDTYTLTLTDVIDGFNFSVLHTNELVAKQPTGNTGHPLIVAEQLTANNDPDPFFVQFTANSVTNSIGFGFNLTGDGTPLVGVTQFNNGGDIHDLVTNLHEDWVSATQSTNGVAGDTIQKGECLTLRFFDLNILPDVNPGAADGGTERLDPTATTGGVVIKFDGIGNSEDLVLILDLKDANGNEITRAVNVQNSDMIKGNANVPAPYNTEFTLDNNDALVIIEANDYNAAGETYQIQGVQIMQSANGLTGQAINLNGAVGTNGGSSATSNLTAWDLLDQDVLKIVDIGFVQQSSGTINASLDFAFNIVDGDGDLLGIQHIPVQIADSFV